ncbi:MAG TPA: symmetrical bis(5'-nucleosyl)-tetraphosphatase [Burkholderiaceae bacterium]|nr:symmetrical bis(5'-nucleosyl)-tetraphosphatase [Burkholderiaceae bacterium]
MSIIVMGDMQGCLTSLQTLLAQFPQADRLIFVGDLVNRGPQSLASLRFVRDLGERAVTVLGNHDLHLLAAAAGIRPLHRDDTLQEILDAPDRDGLLEWLRARPLAHLEAGALFVHAGVLPQWTVEQTLALAREVEAGLRSADHRAFLATMYGNEPARWDDALAGADRMRCVINAFTRIRFVTADGTMKFKLKEGAASAPPGLVPWFDHPARRTHPARGGLPIVFGHWSALGLVNRADIVCLDTGCVWGGKLSAMRWPDRALWQVDCPQARVPGAGRR